MTQTIPVRPEPVDKLGTGKVEGRAPYVGAPVALVVAADRYVAEDGADLIGVDYEPLPVVEGLLRVGVTWDVIEAALGLNETAFRALKKRLSASNRS